MVSKRTRSRRNDHGARISWDRVRAIFGSPAPPHYVWEQQFDDFDKELRKLAVMPYHKIDFSDLWYYYHDLAYVELQPELFNYLFPACLMDWHETLMSNQACSHGDSEFHFGLVNGDVLNKMLTDRQRTEVAKFFRDSFLKRLDVENELWMSGMEASAYGWLERFNSLGIIMPVISDVWDAWWRLESTGRAISAVQYLSGVMYFDGENPIFDTWTPELGGGGPYLWTNDSFVYSKGWLPENVDFLAGVLNFAFVASHLQQATTKLAGHAAHAIAEKILSDLPNRRELVESRTAELPKLLHDQKAESWSM